MKSSATVGREICAACYTKERNGEQICAGCNKLKVILIKSKQLCKRCYNNLCAPTTLKAYTAIYSSPFTYNKFVFDLFAESIKWSTVGEKVASRIISFGRFLQIQQLPEPLSWEAIIKLLPPLQATNRTIPKQVRMCLLELGHLLVAKGKLESWEAYSKRRYALNPIKYAPKGLREIMLKYAEWLWEKHRTAKTVRLHLDALVRFGEWCICSDILLPDDAQPHVVEKYLDFISWSCSICQREKIERGYTGKCPQPCSHPGTHKPNIELEHSGTRYASAVRNCLKVFFDWMVIERVIPSNPVETKYLTRKPQIPHYPLEIIKPLCAYMTSPDADPTEALILYLIIFHGLSGNELRRTLLPSDIIKAESLSALADAYYLLVPAPPISCHNHSLGRPDQRVRFLPEFAEWLKPLLARFEHQRQQNLTSESNRYLLVAPTRKKHNVPVGRCFVRLVVRRASLRILNAICLPRLLRMTSAVMIVQRGGAGCLMLTAWEGQQAFVYSWAPRRVIHPKALESGQYKEQFTQC